jgi:hypothetical protein
MPSVKSRTRKRLFLAGTAVGEPIWDLLAMM